jgi:hypothetical protein
MVQSYLKAKGLAHWYYLSTGAAAPLNMNKVVIVAPLMS